MSNNLYKDLGNNSSNQFSQMAGAITQFAKTIKGDPQQIVEGMLKSGQMTQTEFNRYSQMAQHILPFLK